MAVLTNANQIVVGASGNVYVAPVGTAAPTDLTTAMAAAWIDLGFLTEDGVTFTPSWDIEEISAWQSFRPVRRISTSRSEEVSFEMQQWNKFNFPLAFGGGSVTTTTGVHKFIPPTASARDERAMVIDWADGTKKYRLIIPKGEVTDGGEMNLTRTDSASLPVTFAINGTDGTDPFYLLTDDAAFV